MTRFRVPIWWLTAAMCFPAYFALLVYCDVTRPEFLGMQFSESQLSVTQVVPGSPADRAGIAPGDTLVAIDGQSIANRLDLEAMDLNIQIGRPNTFTVARNGTSVDAILTLKRTAARYWLTRQGLVLLAVRGMQGVTVALALFIAFKRPRDPVARVGAWLLGGAGVFCIALPYRSADVWRHLPLIVGLPLWLPCLSTYVGGAISYAFFLMFPRRRNVPLLVWVVTLLPVVIALGLYAPFLLHAVYTPGHATGVPLWPSKLLLAVNVLYVIAGFSMLVRNYRQTADVNDRRRVRVLVIGSICGWVGGIPVIYAYWHAAADLSRSMFSSSGVTLGTCVFLIFPLSFAYGILRHRLFDLSVIIRQGVRYALARQALLSVVPILAVLLALDMIWHGDRPLLEVLRWRGGVYLAMGALAITAHVLRPRWLDALDHRFFRERYDARRILARLVTDIREVGSFERVAPRAVDQINEALHPSCVALLVRAPGANHYAVVASVPPDMPPPFSPDSTIAGLARVLAKPIDVSLGEDDWLRAQLPDAEAKALQGARIELVVPIVARAAGSTAASETEVLLVLGVKRSEEPYGDDDHELLAAIGDSLALLIDRGNVTPVAASLVAECPTCGTCYDSSTGLCAHEGATLAVTRLPRVLAARYRIERRLGHGGMGAVYEARDLALDRLVAAKVMRDALSGSKEAADRFQQEARAAARLTHPNVVTVHDYGVTPEQIAFLIMEVLDGVTLRGELQQCARIEPPRALMIVRDVAAAIDAAHREQILHRDLKPENIFLVRSSSHEVAKVVDFGIAKSLGADRATDPTRLETNPALMLGTPRYMAPEQLRGEEPRPSWDLWALAIVAYEMLTGTHPFDGVGITALPGNAPAYKAHLGSRLPAGMIDGAVFFARALAPDPSARPASAQEFLEAFERVMGPGTGLAGVSQTRPPDAPA